MTGLALLQLQVSVDETWLDYFIIGVYFLFVLGIGAVLRSRMRSSEDYFLSGRSLPSWVTGLAFLGANLGALEILGMGAGAAQYGIMTAHFYWIGAIPAMVFIALFMIPFYYGSRVVSVPGYLKRRYNEATRGFNAVLFAIFMILLSGLNMYAMAIVFQLLLGWSITASIFLSAGIIMTYVVLGGLSSSIFNEVLQFFLITLGLSPLVIFALVAAGGWSGLQETVNKPEFFHMWADTGGTDNPMAAQWFAIVFGLGFVMSFGYWCTDFLVVQRALAAEDLAASQRTPLIAAFPKILYGILAIFPGLIALSVFPELGQSPGLENSYNMAIPYVMAYYLPTGMLGLGLTALLASFMSGMAGNVTAFNTVWTYDIYRAYIRPDEPDGHYVTVGRLATVVGVLLSIGTAYAVLAFESILDYLQLLHGIFLAPLFATFLLGMFWRRTTPWAGFAGLVAGTTGGLALWVFELMGLISYGSPMAGNFWRAIWAWVICFGITIIVTLLTSRSQKTDEELEGLVWGLTEKKEAAEPAWYKKPWVLGVAALAITFVLNIIFF
ncbi:MAG TPA: sodium:solute symporter family protein [Rubrobacteraceae bacterium]|nr:sodium:solute symporter family protein [Rubrobacteraceae bacterium]